MPNFYLLFGVIAVAAAILWASRQGKEPAPPTHASDGQAPHPLAWIGFSLLGTGLLAAGVVMCFHPGEPSMNAKWISAAMYVAYWLMGDYGPAIAFTGLGVACLVKAYPLVRDL